MSIETWLPPAAIIAVVVAFNTILSKRIDDLGTRFDKRIDDLREQMKSDHANLANHLIKVEQKLDEHISNYSIHNLKQ